MRRVIILDSSPLGLLLQKLGFRQADECREWLKHHVASGAEIVVPEIVNYELRRELLRLKLTRSLVDLAAFNGVPGRLLPISSAALDLAAELWAGARQAGKPTAGPQALDVDVILSAQVLCAGYQPGDFVVATTNVDHLSQFVPAQDWRQI